MSTGPEGVRATLVAWSNGRMERLEDLEAVVELLAKAGCVAAREEAEELFASAAGHRARLADMVSRRLSGEPVAWITGSVSFCGVPVQVDPGVYVPRWQTEPLTYRAVERLSGHGVAVELCTGSGAIAKVLGLSRPGARVVACDIDERACDCASANGVEVYRGDLFEAVPAALAGTVEVVVGVVPYVPTSALRLLPRDTLVFESTLSYDGGPDGTDLLRRAVAGSSRFLKPGGALLLELGGVQDEALSGDLRRAGFVGTEAIRDDDGELRGIETTLDGRAGTVSREGATAD